MMKRICVIMPVHNSKSEWQRGALDSIANQKGIGEEFSVEVVRVYRHDNDIPLVDCSLPCEDLEFDATGFEFPTSVEQVIRGIDYAREGDFDLITSVSSNDILCSSYYHSSVNAISLNDVFVSYGNRQDCDENMKIKKVVFSVQRFNPAFMLANSNSLVNSIPDIAVFKSELLSVVRPDCKHGRAALMIWWIRVWEELGELAFVNINKIAHRMRGHVDRDCVKDRTSFVENGKCIAFNWAKDRFWFKDSRVKVLP